ncbi:MAG: iron ABC transporter permease [Thiobacillus sp.]|jgi:iron(III) transport system permease protein|uniref:ABC transporter permease n=1 Tax=Thiobacillus sp. TaxID=924 RepID=UPI0028941473|nr:iron ABC transporter permease [Thiobacillus sp.]MDT3707497.1 iron ABC transporter permease [Thiobacillus sp.]
MLIALAVAMLVMLPIIVTFSSFAQVEGDILPHLAEFVLPELVANTLWLVLGVGIGVSVLGVSLAWLTAMCEFPGRRVFDWALLLPLALPAYVTAFVAIGLLDFTGPLQTWLRESWRITGLPEIRSRGGVILVMSLALYPYVYLIARNAFATQGAIALEAAQSLGLSRTRGFFRVALPMARPWIAAGLMLALMETLADFGTMAIFNYDTFTTAIYKAWYSLFSLPAAAQLASILILFVLVTVVFEQRSRTQMRYGAVGRSAALRRISLSPALAGLAFAYAGAVLAIAFLIPVAQLALWTREVVATDLDTRYWSFTWHSVLLAGIGALMVVAVALLLAYAGRQRPGSAMLWTQRLATLGYAFPGAVLAVGLFIPVAALDNWLIDTGHAWFGFDGTEILKGTLLVMLLAYLVRFLAVGFGPIDSGLHRITRNIDEAAKNLGTGTGALLARVHLPMLRASLLTAGALAFVDIMKEMPITLMTRPFGWDTLAVRVFEMTSEGEWERAALPSLAIVIAGIIPVILLTWRGAHSHG